MKDFLKKTFDKAKKFVKKHKNDIIDIAKIAACVLGGLLFIKGVYTAGYEAGRDDEIIRISKLNSVINF